MKRTVSLKRTAKNLLSFIAYLCITKASGNYLPVSVALLVANLYVDFKPLASFILCFLPYIFSFDGDIIISAGLGCAFLSATFYLFSRRSKKPKFLIFYTLIAVLPYFFMTDFYPLYLKIALAALILPLPYIFISAAKVWAIKGLKYKLSADEIIAAAGLYCLVGYGAINLFGYEVWKAFAVLFVLLSSAVSPYGYGAFTAFASAVPLSVYSLSFTPIAVFGIYFIVSSVFTGYSRLLSGLSVVGAELLLYYLTSAFKGYGVESALYILIPVCAFVFIPEVVFKRLRNDLKIYRSPAIGRYAVNRDRATLSAKLYDIAAVFSEMTDSIEKLGVAEEDKEETISRLLQEVKAESCYGCKSLGNCRQNFYDEDLEKTLRLGYAKGKINLIDLPKNLSSMCVNAENLVDKINAAIDSGKKREDEIAAKRGGREILKFQALGLSDALKGLALSFSKNSEFDSETEKKVRDSLIKCGVYPYEILAFEGDGEDIDVVVPSSAPEKPYFLKAISEAVGYKVAIVGRTNLSSATSALTLKRAPSFDAAFGIAQKTKDGERYSGDTHSITKISESKFLVALNDGMGSGEAALNTSAVATSLIETFYKSGLPSKIILSIVNKLLCFDREDNFTAMDIGIVDLSDGSADFIKIGSPYSFVITKDSVKIVEGSSVPLGILEDVKPTVCKTTLEKGDMIVFISDGVADAFGSSGEMIEFLSTQRALNPKTLADDLIEKATILSGGKISDDMTAFCVRIFN